MKNLVLVIVILGIGVLGYFLFRDRDATPVPVETMLPALPGGSAATGPAPIRFPVPAPEPAAAGPDNIPAELPLPELDQSDGPVRDALAGLFDIVILDRLFSFESIIRHFVVMVDNMTAAKMPQKYRFTLLPTDKFIVRKHADGEEYIDQSNYARYDPYVRFIESMNVDRTVNLYFRYYPLFQQAYEELGYPDRYFNDRLIEVTDHLLAAPVLQEPIPLKQPKVYYTYADPDLESLSAGQKLMLRIGSDNAGRVKNRLRQLRIALAAQR